MASFAARGFLRLDAVVPEAVNQAFLDQVDHVAADEVASIREHYGRIMAGSAIPRIAAGTPLATAYPADSPVRRVLDVPAVRGAITSLVGAEPTFDHHFLHITYPPEFYQAQGAEPVSQPYHQDSTIDTRRAFDIQLMYFPHDTSAAMGGTRFLPGSHLRIVSEAAIARYQNVRGQEHVVCPAGTVLILHHGIWHGGGVNRSNRLRYMFKIRLCPTQPQVRLWDTADLPATGEPQRPIFWTGGVRDRDSVAAILTRPEPWFEQDTARLEYINRVRLWRYLTGDPAYDADYWATRIENEQG
ncbi:MAG: phytanoyl-CoA dioxygenase [Gammaproteobacteria bacterium]|nr:phytanoyl-CoA dioxygenase [Gammaproteobacteria bacterium]